MSRSRVWSIPVIEDKAKQFCNQVSQVLPLAPSTSGASRWQLLSYNDRLTGKGGLWLDFIGSERFQLLRCKYHHCYFLHSFLFPFNFWFGDELYAKCWDWLVWKILSSCQVWLNFSFGQRSCSISLFPVSLFGSFKRFSFLVCSPAYFLKFHWASQLHLGWVSLPDLWQKLST